mgnify:FL=1
MRVKDYKGVAYFKSYEDAKGHMEKYAKIGRLVSYIRGWAVQTRISGPYLNKTGDIT